VSQEAARLYMQASDHPPSTKRSEIGFVVWSMEGFQWCWLLMHMGKGNKPAFAWGRIMNSNA